MENDKKGKKIVNHIKNISAESQILKDVWKA